MTWGAKPPNPRSFRVCPHAHLKIPFCAPARPFIQQSIASVFTSMFIRQMASSVTNNATAHCSGFRGLVMERIETVLHATFAPTHLEVHNESHMHSAGKESHFKVVVVSGAFEGIPSFFRRCTIWCLTLTRFKPCQENPFWSDIVASTARW